MNIHKHAYSMVHESIVAHAFRHPKGILGRFGGMIMARTNRRMARQAIALLGVQPTDRVLEIGFGPGIGIRLLARTAAAGRVSGIDHSEEMLEQARARNAKAIATGRVTLVRGLVEALPFDNAAFDRVMAIRSMQTWSDTEAGLREIRRVLRPGGRVVLGFTHQSGQTQAQLTAVLTATGFAYARVLDVDGALYALATAPN